jgi:hypothetical protein
LQGGLGDGIVEFGFSDEAGIVRRIREKGTVPESHVGVAPYVARLGWVQPVQRRGRDLVLPLRQAVVRYHLFFCLMCEGWDVSS